MTDKPSFTGTLDTHGLSMLNSDFFKQPGMRPRLANILRRLATWIDDPIQLTDRELHAANETVNRLRLAMNNAQKEQYTRNLHPRPPKNEITKPGA